MPVFLTEGFDALNNDVVPRKYSVGGGWLTTGRFGQQGWTTNTNNQNSVFGVNFPVVGNTLTAGFAFKIPSYSELGPNGFGFLKFNGAAGRQFTIGVDNAGAIRFGPGTSIAAHKSANGVVTPGSWQYWEISVFVHDTAGSVRICIDGVEKLNVTNTDTKGLTADDIINMVCDTSGSGYPTGYCFDDMYFSNDLTQLGPQKIETFRADGEISADWTPSSGANNWQMVDDWTCDDDWTFISATDAGKKAVLTLANMTDTPQSIAAVSVEIIARMDDIGPRNVEFGIDNGTDPAVTKEVALTDVYRIYSDLHLTNPFTSGPWTDTAVNALRMNIESV